MERIRIIDSHTGGEPTRVIVDGGPPLGTGPLSARRDLFHRQFDRYRSAVVNEPRGSDVIVGALLVPPENADSVTGVIYFNNVGMIGMCGHGTIGLVTTLAHMGRIGPGRHRIDTPVGTVTTELHRDGDVSVVNVASRRTHAGVAVDVDVNGMGRVTGDIAWGGNWFYLVQDHGQRLSMADVASLTDVSSRIRVALGAAGHPDVDHVELFGAGSPGASSKSFVLCPGNAYDRSPCGTGTSAKLACLAADGKLVEGAPWVQESIVGTRFTATYRWLDRDKGEVEPTIRGRAFVNAESVQLLDPRDPFCWGIPPQ